MIKVGQKVRFNQFHYDHGKGGPENIVTGTVIYVNEPHRYFTTSYEVVGETGYCLSISMIFTVLVSMAV